MKLSAVLPLSISERKKSNSCELADILFSSIKKFAPRLFKTIFVICPSNQRDEISNFFQKLDDQLPIEIVDEEELVPELTKFKTVGGWTKQQIIKLACASIVNTPYYVTFDADVICTHPIKEEFLFCDNKAIMQASSRKIHPNWWTSSAHILGLPVDLEAPGMSVTPAILSKELVLKLIDELSSNENWVEKLLKPHRKFALQRFIPEYRKRYRWTEYSLYFLFLEKNNLLGKWHVLVYPGSSEKILISQNSVWNANDFEEWDDELCFSDRDQALFAVIQSNKNILPSIIRDRVARYLD